MNDCDHRYTAVANAKSITVEWCVRCGDERLTNSKRDGVGGTGAGREPRPLHGGRPIFPERRARPVSLTEPPPARSPRRLARRIPYPFNIRITRGDSR